MRRCVPLCLALLAFGCKSPEERACENMVPILAAAAAENGRAAQKNESQQQRDCVESLGRLRREVLPDEDMWFAYLRCLRAATTMGEQSECLEPLIESQQQAVQGKAPTQAK